MALNIKSKEADSLVEQVAKLTGESKTQAVIESLRQRLEREQRVRDGSTLAADLVAIGKKCAAYPRQDSTDHGALLYDETGMPR